MAARPRTTPRKAPKQDRSQATVEVLLTATARVLVRDGYDRASTNRIAKEAGVSVGSLYQYFPSKEALVAALIERHFDRCVTTLEQKFVELSAQPPQIVARDFIDVMIMLKSIDPELERVLLEQVPRVGRLGKMREIDERLARLIRVYIEAHRDVLRPENAEASAFILVKMGYAVAHAIICDRPSGIAVETLVQEFNELVLRYMLVPEGEIQSKRPARNVARNVVRSANA